MHDSATTRVASPLANRLWDGLATLPVAVWVYLTFFRSGYWKFSRHVLPPSEGELRHRKIAAVIPARNEADVVGQSIRSLLLQTLPVPLQIVLVDDGSEDGTAEAARQEAKKLRCDDRLIVVQGSEPPAGWAGKLWAMSQGIEHASLANLDYILLTDADILHGPETVSRLLQVAEEEFDLASIMVRLATQTGAEKFLIPAFVYFFLQLYPPAWISSRARRTAGAAGGCMLIRTATLTAIGGIESISGALIDDCALARRVKDNGGSVWLGLSNDSTSLRSYGGFWGVGSMISRSAFNQLQHSSALLVCTLGGLFITYVLPPVLLFSKRPSRKLLGAAASILMAATYRPATRLYGQQRASVLTLPLVALFYAAATLHSAVSYWRGSGGRWKGRIQDRLTS